MSKPICGEVALREYGVKRDEPCYSRGPISPHVGLDVFFFNSKTTADISKWYKTFSFPLTHSTARTLFKRYPI